LFTSAAVAACADVPLDAILVPAGSSGSIASTGAVTSGAASGAAASTGTSGSVANAGSSTGGSAGSMSAVPGQKRGLAYGGNTYAELLALNNNMMGPVGVSWWQNWTAFPDLSLDGGAYPIEYVPMVWDTNFTVAGVESQIPPGMTSKYLLTFYLPNVITDADGKTQSQVTVADAVMMWPDIEKIAGDLGLKIVSPSVDYCDPSSEKCLETSPLVWMQDFVEACPSCRFDYLGVSSHECDYPSFARDLSVYERTFPGKPLWIASFGCTNGTLDPVQMQQFMLSAVYGMENDTQVFRYAWFTGFSKSGDAGASPYSPYSLLQGPGSPMLTPLGTAYVNAPVGN